MLTRNVTVLDDSALMRLAPSVFAAGAHSSRSERYAYIPTIDAVNALRAEGFEVLSAQQSRTRDASRRAYTKHMVKLARASDLQAFSRVGEVAPQVCLINSHDGSGAYHLHAGMLRFACLNGLIVSDGELADFRVLHSGNIRGRVIEGSYTVIDTATRAAARAMEWKALTLDRNQQLELADAALRLRWDDRAPLLADQVLQPRRWADTANDLWSTFNRVQENVTRAGLRSRGRTESGRRMAVRSVRGIDTSIALNRDLWALAETTAQRLALAA